MSAHSNIDQKSSCETGPWLLRQLSLFDSSVECFPDRQDPRYFQYFPLLLVSHDTTDMLRYIQLDIEEIIAGFSHDNAISNYALSWRGRLCAHEHSLELIQRMIEDGLSMLNTLLRNDPPGDKMHPANIADFKDLYRIFMEMQEKSRELKAKVQLSSQQLLAHVSMISMREQIIEARSVANLTELAFFFIPLSFAAAVFSMQIKACVLMETNMDISLIMENRNSLPQ